uniref:Metastasis suppressor protein 1-like n=1 Tax=Acanthochromis polyacanthus TaxID=80966 RepID=A0A3Q1FGQ0_9TELE
MGGLCNQRSKATITAQDNNCGDWSFPGCFSEGRRHSNWNQRALSESLITPLELKMEEWKKVASQLDKDHAKEYKRARADIKKKSSDTIKLQKKVKKGKTNCLQLIQQV